MTLRLAGRDRSGRIPRASRALTFYQAAQDWNAGGPQREILEPVNPPMHTEDYDRSDEIRGQGY